MEQQSWTSWGTKKSFTEQKDIKILQVTNKEQT